MKRLWLGLICAAWGCYSPDLTGVRYSCDETNPYCPDGLTCIAGSCQPPGTMENLDGGTGAPPDGAVAVAGCRSGIGYALGQGFGCPGRFNGNPTDQIPTASQLCADGYKICTMSTGIDLAMCKMLPGFFAAAVEEKRASNDLNPANFQCGSPGRNQTPLWAGCGRTTKDDVYDAPTACGGFGQALDCSQDKNWDCYINSLDGVENRNSFDGVLCCH